MHAKPLFLGFAILISTANVLCSAIFTGNGSSGFGGVVSSLAITDDGTDITFTLNRGPGGLNDRLVIYLDTTPGGETNTSGYTDTGDPLRMAISGYSGLNRSTVSFPAGFDIDRAIGLDWEFGGLWDPVNNGSHNFLATGLAYNPGRSTSLPSYSMTFSIADLGIMPGDSFDFVATYLNSGTAFRSNEGVGDGLPGGITNIGQAPAVFTGYRTYITQVPEPTIPVLGFLAGVGLLARRRRD